MTDKVRIIPVRYKLAAQVEWVAIWGDTFAYGFTPEMAFRWLKRSVLADCAVFGHKPPRWALGDAVV